MHGQAGVRLRLQKAVGISDQMKFKWRRGARGLQRGRFKNVGTFDFIDCPNDQDTQMGVCGQTRWIGLRDSGVSRDVQVGRKPQVGCWEVALQSLRCVAAGCEQVARVA